MCRALAGDASQPRLIQEPAISRRLTVDVVTTSALPFQEKLAGRVTLGNFTAIRQQTGQLDLSLAVTDCGSAAAALVLVAVSIGNHDNIALLCR